MDEHKSSYREIFKTFNIFGGVQVFEVIVDFLRSKILSVLLGPGGIGLNNLIRMPIDFVWQASSMGIYVSGIREISTANTNGDDVEVSRKIITVQRWSKFSGVLGMLIMILLSGFLYNITLNDHKDAIDTNFRGNSEIFIYLSVVMLFTAFGSGKNIILYAMRRVKDNAMAKLFSSLFGLIVALPFYYFWGINGIVPALICISIVQMSCIWFFSSKVKLKKIQLPLYQSFTDGKQMVKMGILFSMSTLAALGANYLISLFLNATADKETVGLYTTGWGLTNRCVNLVFTAIAIDYFPRLCGFVHDHRQMSDAVNHQADIALLSVAPLMILYISFLPLIVLLLNTSAFLPIVGFVQWFLIGMLFKTASWALSYIFLAKGDNGLYLVLEVITNILYVGLNICGYLLFGLEGMGIAFVILYLFYFSLQLIVCKIKYDITFYRGFRKIFAVQFVLSLLCFLSAFLKSYPFTFFAGSMLFILSALYSFRQLDARIGLKEGLRNYFSKFRKKRKSNDTVQ